MRSWPSSCRLAHFNRPALKRALANAGIAYLWFGKELGGKGDGGAASPMFRNRIHELTTLSKCNGVVIMSAEGDPLRCHHKNLLANSLTREGVEIFHILGDGSLAEDKDAQLSLFEDG